MEPQVEPPGSTPLTKRVHADVYAVGAFLILFGAIFLYRALNDGWLAEYDILSYFLPWYGHLGGRLRELDIPGWMPWLSSGSPVAGDPSGGWWYLPVMMTFPFFDAASAFKGMILIQTLLGGLSIYAFSRFLGLRSVAALMSAVAYVFGPFLSSQLMFGTVAGQVSAWLPLALLGVECALRAPRTMNRVGWWAVSGLAISQIAAAWPGQGLYNSLLLIAGWVAYRSLIWSPRGGRPRRVRVLDALTTGPAVVLLGLLLGAAGLLPRLDISRQSNIPNGDYSGVIGGDYLVQPHSLVSLLRDTLVDAAQFRPVAVGAPVVILIVLAPLLGRWRHGIPFFAVVTLCAGMLSMDETPLHRLFYLLPEFESLHTHAPRRVLWVCFFAPAMLAGAGLEALLSWRPQPRTMPLLGVPLLVVGAGAVTLASGDVWIGWWPLAAAVVMTALAVMLANTWRAASQSVLRSALIVAMVLLTGLYSSGRAIESSVPDVMQPAESPDACLTTYLSRSDPDGAGAFLQQQQESAAPFRFVSYAGRDPSTDDDPSYSWRRCELSVLGAIAGGRAIRLELESTQGYNPLHLGYYSEYIDVMNGGQQNYHWVDPYPQTLRSDPLLDMLNVRFIVVGVSWPYGAWDVLTIGTGKEEVFRNEHVVVFENPNAYPRAWIVHQVFPNADGEGLRHLARGEIDGRRIAYVDGPLPDVEPRLAAGQGGEEVTIVRSEGDALTATVRADSAGLVVFSEVYEEGWVAYVDGKRTEILRTNHALRGVPVTAGEHTIEMRYEPTSLRVGLATSGVTAFAVAIVWTLALSGCRGDRGER